MKINVYCTLTRGFDPPSPPSQIFPFISDIQVCAQWTNAFYAILASLKLGPSKLLKRQNIYSTEKYDLYFLFNDERIYIFTKVKYFILTREYGYNKGTESIFLSI